MGVADTRMVRDLPAPWTTNGYAAGVRVAIRFFLVTLICLAAVIGGTSWLLKTLPTGFVPDEDQGYYIVNALLPEGASLERNDAVIGRIERQLAADPAVADVLSLGGYNLMTGTYSSYSSALFVILKPWEARRAPSLSLDAAMAAVEMEYFISLYRSLDLPPGALLRLQRSDGVVLVTSPFEPALLGSVQPGCAGAPQAVSAGARVNDLPLTLCLMVPRDMVLRRWFALAWMIGPGVLAAVAGIGMNRGNGRTSSRPSKPRANSSTGWSGDTGKTAPRSGPSWVCTKSTMYSRK